MSGKNVTRLPTAAKRPVKNGVAVRGMSAIGAVDLSRERYEYCTACSPAPTIKLDYAVEGREHVVKCDQWRPWDPVRLSDGILTQFKKLPRERGGVDDMLDYARQQFRISIPVYGPIRFS